MCIFYRSRHYTMPQINNLQHLKNAPTLKYSSRRPAHLTLFSIRPLQIRLAINHTKSHLSFNSLTEVNDADKRAGLSGRYRAGEVRSRQATSVFLRWLPITENLRPEQSVENICDLGSHLQVKEISYQIHPSMTFWFALGMKTRLPQTVPAKLRGASQ